MLIKIVSIIIIQSSLQRLITNKENHREKPAKKPAQKPALDVVYMNLDRNLKRTKRITTLSSCQFHPAVLKCKLNIIYLFILPDENPNLYIIYTFILPLFLTVF